MKKIVWLAGLLIVMLVSWVSPARAVDEAMEATMAKSLLDKCVALIAKEGAINAFYQMNTRPDQFAYGEIYVWVVNSHGVIFAHSVDPTLVGSDLNEVEVAKDDGTRKLARELVKTLQAQEEGTVEYEWFNPSSGKIEHKQSFFKQVYPPKVVASFYVLTGYFTPHE